MYLAVWCRHMSGFNQLPKLLCYILSCKNKTTVYCIKLNELKKSIKGEINVYNNVVPEDLEEETDVNLNGVIYREQSPFGRHSELIYANILVSTAVENYSQNDPENVAYAPQIVEFSRHITCHNCLCGV